MGIENKRYSCNFSRSGKPDSKLGFTLQSKMLLWSLLSFVLRGGVLEFSFFIVVVVVLFCFLEFLLLT